jgi:hypothetical protein
VLLLERTLVITCVDLGVNFTSLLLFLLGFTSAIFWITLFKITFDSLGNLLTLLAISFDDNWGFLIIFIAALEITLDGLVTLLSIFLNL